jgi:hypothetical protein
VSEIAPPRPAVATPLLKVIDPLLPEVEPPVESKIHPDDPVVPEFDVLIVI